jgi:hypothetical protein
MSYLLHCFKIWDRNSRSGKGGTRSMNRHPMVAVIVVLCLGLFCSYHILENQVQAQGKAAAPALKITVLNPLGTPPPIKLKTMAPRLNTLEGKTIYVVNQGYLGTDNLLAEMIVWLERECPKTKFVYKTLGMSMSSQPPPLFAEIKEKADAVIMGLGH